MKEMLARRLFIWRTRLNVELSNFAVTRAFLTGFAPWKSVAAPIAVSVALLFFVSAATVSYFTGAPVDNTVAAIPAIQAPAIPQVPVSLPEVTIEADPDIRPNYIIAVDKFNSRLLVLKEGPEYFEVIRDYGISLGQMIGSKESEGDLRTPEGYYRIVEVKDGDALPSIYGPQAFVLNYPNSFDTALGRTGGGIWLHGSGQGKRTPDTRGCVELDDDKIIALGDWVGIDTTVAIFPANFALPVVDGKIEKQYITTRFFYGDISDITPTTSG